MECIRTPEAMRAWRRTLTAHEQPGFVPTMGNLHEGHLALVERSLRENPCTVVSLLVNPTQFNDPADFTHYPRTEEADLALLQKAGVTCCFLPEPDAIYPDHYTFRIEEHQASLPMEGHARPGHFTGMLTVVMKLLQLVQPGRAYFGEKDYQQAMLVRAMTEAFFMDTAIVLCPTIRETSGLPFSSRNRRLSPEGRSMAHTFAKIFHANRPDAETLQAFREAGIPVDYLETHAGRRYVAVRIEGIRLIDNHATK